MVRLGEGDPVRVVEVEDEQAEARFVAARIAGLFEDGYAGGEISVFYRMVRSRACSSRRCDYQI